MKNEENKRTYWRRYENKSKDNMLIELMKGQRVP